MEYDFSKQAEEFLKSFSEDGLGEDRKKTTLFDKVVYLLDSKVKEHNKINSKKVSLSQLKKVYRRGSGVFSSIYRPNKTRGQWAMARVNMFLKMMRGGDIKDSYKKADQDIAQGSEDFYIEKEGEAFIDFEEIDFILARLDFVRINALGESNQEIEDIDFSEAEKKTLNKPFRLPKGSNKKFGVYVKNPKTGNIIIVKFGDPNMEIKRDDPERRKNFRARHKCDTAKDKTTPRYWSCKMWSKKPVNKSVSSEAVEWDDEELVSEWGWDEDLVVDYEDFPHIFLDLNNIDEIEEDC